MELKKLHKNTYMLKNKYANIGVYMKDEKNCILIDSGVFNYTKELFDFFEESKLNILGIINTHGHEDHIGGNYVFKQRYGCIIATPYVDHIFTENFSNFFFTLSSVPFKHLEISKPYSYETDIIIKKNMNQIRIGEIPFGLFHLPGHTLNHTGIVTPDNVIFVGDALLDIDIMNNSKFPFCLDIKQDIESKKKLLATHFDLYVPGHGKALKNIDVTVKNNINAYIQNSNYVLEILEKPLSLDELMKQLLNKFPISKQLFTYFNAEYAVKALLTYLEKEEKIKLIIEDHNLKYMKIV